MMILMLISVSLSFSRQLLSLCDRYDSTDGSRTQECSEVFHQNHQSNQQQWSGDGDFADDQLVVERARLWA